MSVHTKDQPAFENEAALCAAFIAAVDEKWTPYPETGGFDILLSRKDDGFQIGIEAKLKLNTMVLAQALEDGGWRHRKTGPDCRAVLVPSGAAVSGAGTIAAHLALTVISMRPPKARWRHGSGSGNFNPGLPDLEERYWFGDDWHELCPEERIKLPDYRPDVTAGSSAPIKLTAWKIKAIKIAIIAERRGYVTRSDFKDIGIDIRRWIDGRWLMPGPNGFTLATDWLKRQHPKVYEEIAADYANWKRPSLVDPVESRTEALL